MLTPSRRALARVIATLSGAAAGWSGGVGSALEWSESSPTGWHREVHNAAYMSEATLGDLAPAADAYSLSAYSAFRATHSASAGTVRAELGKEGQLWLLPAAEGESDVEGFALALTTGEAPRGERLRAGARATPAACTGALPTPGPDDYTLSFTMAQVGWEFRSGGGTLTCPSAGGQGKPALIAGLHRVRLHELTLDEVKTPLPSQKANQFALTAAGAGIAAVVTEIELFLGLSSLALVALAVPLLALPTLGGLNLNGLHEALRVPTMRVQMLPLMVALSLVVVGRGAVYGAALSRAKMPDRGAVALGGVFAVATIAAIVSARGLAWLPAATGASLGGVLGACAVLRAVRRTGFSLARASLGIALFSMLFSAIGRFAEAPPLTILWLALAGAACGLLVQLSVHAPAVRLYNTVSLLTAGFALCGMEFAVRNTSVGPLWDATNPVQGAGNVATLAAQLDALHASKHATYPSAGYPVEAPAKTHRVRIVTLGGSSTAGAWQNTDIREFYPALMAAHLPEDVEVVNQGTGGWNTLHIALFAQSSLVRLEPDIVTVYTGVNEVVQVPVAYKDLYRAWQSGALHGEPAFLGRIRLFQGLRNIVRALRPAVVAVPPEDTADNLTAVIAAARAQHAHVLLLSEAVQPRPEAFEAYWAVMRRVAAQNADDVAFYDTAEAIRPLGRAAFLDHNHLSPSGHARAAELISAELVRLGWLNPVPR